MSNKQIYYHLVDLKWLFVIFVFKLSANQHFASCYGLRIRRYVCVVCRYNLLAWYLPVYLSSSINKVITTMMIRPLDDPTWFASSVVWLQFQRGAFWLPSLRVRRTWGSGWAHSIARPWVPISFPLTHMIYLVPFLSYLAGSKSVSARPTLMRWQIPL